MNAARKLYQRVRRAPPRAGWMALLIALVLAGMAYEYRGAAADARARKSADARAFEAAPEAWLEREQSISHFGRALAAGELAAVGLPSAHRGVVLYTLKNGDKASAVVPGCSAAACSGSVLERLAERSAQAGFALVSIDVDPRSRSRRVLDGIDALVQWVLLIGFVTVLVFAAARLQRRVGGATTASLLDVRPATRFADVIGGDEAKAALERVKAFMRDPQRYARLGATRPRGVLLAGPPGTGKTLLAKALAGECKAHFIAVDGSYFTAMFFGAGVTKVTRLFEQARRHAPCVLFIDEIDGIGRRSHGGTSGAESEANRIINRVLVEMDGFAPLDNVIVVGATNHEDNIDEAMRRPGRFDLIVRLGLPTLPERQRLFELYLAKVAHDGRADTAALARAGAGMTPAEIANTVNQAASAAAEQGCDAVSAEHLRRAIETRQLGGEVSSIKSLLTGATRNRLAFHEAGHALVGHVLGVGSVERVTIEPRGQALGVTHIQRDSEDPLYHEAELTSRLAMMLAGREAELMVLGSLSSGAADDLKRASELAVKMVGALGFSRRFGLLSVDGVPKELLGPGVQAALLDEARALLDEAQARCRAVLDERRPTLDALAAALLEREVLADDELRSLLGEPPPYLPAAAALAA